MWTHLVRLSSGSKPHSILSPLAVEQHSFGLTAAVSIA